MADDSDRDSGLKGRLKGGMKAASSGLKQMSRDETDRASEVIRPVQYRKGGKVRKTGLATVHKGERVIPKGKTKRVEKMMHKAKMRLKARR